MGHRGQSSQQWLHREDSMGLMDQSSQQWSHREESMGHRWIIETSLRAVN